MVTINVIFADGYIINETKEYSFSWDFDMLIKIHGSIVSLTVDY